ncbi:bifunctional UDP-N-acetylglucosamine diphosphorylase/glucosamine-1-phosphate N-acetyltransferase GlmU [Aerococcaceae bacterium INB8]|uniref:Bifunctional protein GlmU n=1 Tax=Ruoffia halotolerans TaxID=2748684 RepID=A0A839A7P2_9LACT|nr:bifunctional UDP-N-acetylglucosamine diphosphorylase/glucosamine-1-phosphate N-acetyltransferase GlmU [Ruoffia halotolerans]MBA5729565.1 bifunctional UDP-N-acetylglucosamine diphosphorylase/glucosamine-1-phosphate N-acetyltransferase GlmU [Ruoffia halotolerans]
MEKRLAVVLAAGKGTRMKSELYKVLHTINGISMVEHVLRAVQQSNVERIVTIVGHGAETVRDVLADQSEFALQEEQLGTGHAVLQAKDLLKDEEGSTLVICGDTPLFSAETLNQLFKFHEESNAKGTILTAIAEDPTGYGRVVRQSDKEVSRIVEQKDANEEEQAITEINTGTYVFNNKALFEALDKVGNENAQGEYYLPDVISIMKEAGDTVKAFTMDNFDEAIGVNDRIALAEATRLMTKRINEKHMRNGVTFINPTATYIEADVEIGQDTLIESGVSLKGNTKIGSHSTIGSNSEIISSTIADHVEIRQSVLEFANVEENVTVGPFAHLRAKSVLKEGAHIGNFVEVKNSVVGKNSKAGHLTYIGDADIGTDVNVGCGTVFVNYDGKNKFRSTIGNDVFIGSGSNIVAPVTVGDRAIIAAGSTVNSDVPEEALAIARSRQENKDKYWKRFKDKQNLED